MRFPAAHVDERIYGEQLRKFRPEIEEIYNFVHDMKAFLKIRIQVVKIFASIPQTKVSHFLKNRGIFFVQ